MGILLPPPELFNRKSISSLSPLPAPDCSLSFCGTARGPGEESHPNSSPHSSDVPSAATVVASILFSGGQTPASLSYVPFGSQNQAASFSTVCLYVGLLWLVSGLIQSIPSQQQSQIQLAFHKMCIPANSSGFYFPLFGSKFL